MKKAFLLFLLVFACSKDEAGFTSPEGAWTYTTPDNVMEVTFEIEEDTLGALEIRNQTFKLNGVLYDSFLYVDGFNSPAIDTLRINSNDSGLVYPYNIAFKDATISSDFKTIVVPDATYTWPWPDVNNLTDIVVVRK